VLEYSTAGRDDKYSNLSDQQPQYAALIQLKTESVISYRSYLRHAMVSKAIAAALLQFASQQCRPCGLFLSLEFTHQSDTMRLVNT
jgi:hypothetical protein